VRRVRAVRLLQVRDQANRPYSRSEVIHRAGDKSPFFGPGRGAKS
jgi:hypothetical protein